MKIKATIEVEYHVNLEKYRYLDKDNKEKVVRAIEAHSLRDAIFEVLPWSTVTSADPILNVKMEGLE